MDLNSCFLISTEVQALRMAYGLARKFQEQKPMLLKLDVFEITRTASYFSHVYGAVLQNA